MTTTEDLELPIKRQIVDGPAVRALAERKEDDNNARFKQKAGPGTARVLAGLKSLASATS